VSNLSAASPSSVSSASASWVTHVGGMPFILQARHASGVREMRGREQAHLRFGNVHFVLGWMYAVIGLGLGLGGGDANGGLRNAPKRERTARSGRCVRGGRGGCRLRRLPSSRMAGNP
jgi:hypothetical protein